MAHFINHIEPSRINFLQTLHSSPSSQIFSVKYDGTIYCFKVFHMKSDPGYTSDGRDLCRYRAEVKAYHLLHKYGVCKRGHVPSFHGSIDRLDPTHYSPHLDAFLHDEQYPSAILMEYLPNTQPLNCTNYSKERMEKAVAAIEDIHSAGVEQNDTYPKNILIVGGSVERVIFVDFDVAITYEIDNLTAKDIAYLKFETDVVKDLGELLQADQEEGLPPNTKYY